jgi:hypothetical protein
MNKSNIIQSHYCLDEVFVLTLHKASMTGSQSDSSSYIQPEKAVIIVINIENEFTCTLTNIG